MDSITPLILIVIFAMVIGSFILHWVVQNALANSTISKKLEHVEMQLAALKELMEKDDDEKS